MTRFLGQLALGQKFTVKFFFLIKNLMVPKAVCLYLLWFRISPYCPSLKKSYNCWVVTQAFFCCTNQKFSFHLLIYSLLIILVVEKSVPRTQRAGHTQLQQYYIGSQEGPYSGAH